MSINVTYVTCMLFVYTLAGSGDIQKMSWRNAPVAHWCFKPSIVCTIYPLRRSSIV